MHGPCDAEEAVALLEHWCSVDNAFNPSSQFVANVYNALAKSGSHGMTSLTSAHCMLAQQRITRIVPKRLTRRLLHVMMRQRRGVLQLGIGKRYWDFI